MQCPVVIYLNEEPDAGNLHVRILCGGRPVMSVSTASKDPNYKMLKKLKVG